MSDIINFFLHAFYVYCEFITDHLIIAIPAVIVITMLVVAYNLRQVEKMKRMYPPTH